ncbi:hypothetical protein JOB18_043534 [Solea senegalensis]|uniref:Uncharacterized protein n=1 Tax=Solea senegalensis TaxID=28829 RepID=A0AAV6SP74_SOLSE|nr:hypothetical protein JOB18_043534 [Solea senegalensis]
MSEKTGRRRHTVLKIIIQNSSPALQQPLIILNNRSEAPTSNSHCGVFESAPSPPLTLLSCFVICFAVNTARDAGTATWEPWIPWVLPAPGCTSLCKLCNKHRQLSLESLSKHQATMLQKPTTACK